MEATFKFKDLDPQVRIQFARNIVMMGDELHKRITMDDASEWLSAHGEFRLKATAADGSQEIVLTEACREELSNFIFKSI